VFTPTRSHEKTQEGKGRSYAGKPMFRLEEKKTTKFIGNEKRDSTHPSPRKCEWGGEARSPRRSRREQHLQAAQRRGGRVDLGRKWR